MYYCLSHDPPLPPYNQQSAETLTHNHQRWDTRRKRLHTVCFSNWTGSCEGCSASTLYLQVMQGSLWRLSDLLHELRNRKWVWEVKQPLTRPCGRLFSIFELSVWSGSQALPCNDTKNPNKGFDGAKLSTQIMKQVFVGAGDNDEETLVERERQRSPAGISYKLHCNLLVLFLLLLVDQN